jgi:transposase InsO family protein
MALGVRREGYYAWEKRPTREERDEALLSALKQVRAEHPCYGVQSLINELPLEQKVSYGKGYRVCRENGLLLRRHKAKGITKADPAAMAAEDLVRRDFSAQAPNEKLLTDITEMECRDGKLYLCPLMDCYDAAIVGFSMDTNMKASLCAAALNSAIGRWGTSEGCILHSDRGSQFTSHLYRETLESKGFRQSMGRTGTCADNARMESFFATLKKELIYRLPLYRLTRKEVRIYIFEWIAYYNRKRRHTANENSLPPLIKRELYSRGALAA